LGIEGDEGSALFEDNISPLRATMVQRQPPPMAKPLETASVAKPAVIQAGPGGTKSTTINFLLSLLGSPK
jgi:talin